MVKIVLNKSVNLCNICRGLATTSELLNPKSIKNMLKGVLEMRKYIFILIILIFSSCLCASDYYVDANNGSNDNSGRSKDEAWKTITYAISQVQGTEDNPAIIHIGEGKYGYYINNDESFPLKLKNHVSLIGNGCNATIIDGDGGWDHLLSCVGKNSILLKNISFIQGDGIFITNTTMDIVNCIIEKNDHGDKGGGIESHNSTFNIINCKILNNSAGGGYLSYGGGIYSENSNINIVNCEITSNETPCRDYGYGGGIYSLDSNLSIINCLITQNSAWGGYGNAIYAESSLIKMTNCTIANNSETFDKNDSRVVQLINGYYSITNSIIDQLTYQGVGSITNGVNINYSDVNGGYEGEGNIDQDPLFVTGPWGDYYLSQENAGQSVTSPCIDAGNPIPPIGFDYQWRTNRTDGSFDTGRIDMGYHYPPNIQFFLVIDPYKESYNAGGRMKITTGLLTAPYGDDMLVDLYFVLIDPKNNIYSYPTWDMGLNLAFENLSLPEKLSFTDISLFNISFPSERPPINSSGTYTFAILAVKAGTTEPISNLSTVRFNVE